MEHRFEWANNVLLCNARPDLRMNFLHYRQTDKKGKVTTFTWVTDINLSKDTAWAVMRAGRSRWKIENETFNTLKNLGYNFEHNYGHGEDHLSTMFAYLMLLAFNVDQFVQACPKGFQAVRKAFKTKIKFWSSVKAVFQTIECDSMQHLYERIATLYRVKLE